MGLGVTAGGVMEKKKGAWPGICLQSRQEAEVFKLVNGKRGWLEGGD